MIVIGYIFFIGLIGFSIAGLRMAYYSKEKRLEGIVIAVISFICALIIGSKL